MGQKESGRQKMRDNVYTIENRIRFSEIDHTRKITLPGIINYFQDCSIFQSEKIGYGLEYLRENKRAWVLSAWQIVVDRYPQFGENVTTSTFATGFKGIFGERNFCMKDENGKTVAYANSLWVYMDLEKNRPTKPSPEERQAYGVSEPLEMEAMSRKIEVLQPVVEYPSFPVRKYHIDTNEHVNNCQYVQMALEVLPEDVPVRRVRVEYKKSAVYKDIIIPMVAQDGDRIVTELCGKEGEPYAVVEFRM